jgi:hypothetical protein
MKHGEENGQQVSHDVELTQVRRQSHDGRGKNGLSILVQNNLRKNHLEKKFQTQLSHTSALVTGKNMEPLIIHQD